MLQDGWNFYSQWDSFKPQTEKRKLTLTMTQKMTPVSSSSLLKLFVAADPFYRTQNRCGVLRFVKAFSIIGKLDLAVS